MIWTTPTVMAVALSLMTGAPVLAQDSTQAADAPQTEATPAADAAPAPPMWLMSCSNQMNPDQLLCEFSQSIMLTAANQNQRLATASFTRAAGQAETNAVFALPVGVSIPAGATVSVDDTEVGALNYQSCDAQGCYATAVVDDAWLQAMRDGSQLTVTLSSRDGQEIRLGFQLDGFSKTEAMLP